MTDLTKFRYLEEQLFRVAPVPLYDNAASYPNGFDVQISSTYGKTNFLRITPEQLHKIEQVLLGVI